MTGFSIKASGVLEKLNKMMHEITKKEECNA